ncbi:MAG: ABC transporter substrate-binding protein [Clostridia bacterium]|nr:ABC transporter substrate-binding protein [Clostridia bacterium]
MKLFKKIAIGAALVTSVAVVASTGCFGSPTTDLKGVTDTTIYVGNTAGTTGVLSTIGGPFNLGIEAAFYAYNQAGGYKGKDEAGNALTTGLKVELKHYDDGGDPATSKTMTEKLIHEDEVFAIVGNFAAACVNVNLDVIKEAEVPMVYAAAGNDTLHNDKAETLADRGIFPVQPLNKTEGRSLILRAFAPATAGGLAGTKVGVLTDTGNEASISMIEGIEAEKATLPEAQKNAVVIQEVNGSDYGAAVNALKAANCDVVIITSTGGNYLSALKAIGAAEYKVKVLTSYNNASAAPLNTNKTNDNGTPDDPSDDVVTQVLSEEYTKVFENVSLYSQAWLDLTSSTEFYKNSEHALYDIYYATYLALYQLPTEYGGLGMDEATATATLNTYGIPGFKNEYWTVAEDIYDYCIAQGKDAGTAYAMSYDAYALAGYIAGDLFIQGLDALEESGKALTRENYVDVMESADRKIITANDISFANGLRQGVDSFALTQIYVANGAATSATIHTLTSLDAYRELIKG